MSSRSCFFSLTDKLARSIADKLLERKWNFKSLGYIIFILGFISPLPLVIYVYYPDSYLRIISPVLLSFYVILDYTFCRLEVQTRQRSALNAFIPFPVPIFIFLWYEIFLCEVIYQSAGILFFRYYNIFAVCCAVAGLLLIFGYLKLRHEPLNIHRFTERLEQIGLENEKDAPLNYITLSFKVMKQDLFACVLLVLSFFNLYVLYFIVTLASIGFLGFTVYSLILMRVLLKRNSN
jgi:hypothetical protein